MRKSALGLGLGCVAVAAPALDRLARRAIARFETVDPDATPLPGRRFWVRGVAVHYRERGRGFPVVLVHSFGGSTFSMRYTEEALAGHFRVLNVDLPGFGFSSRDPRFQASETAYARLLGDLLERLDVPRAAFVGCGLGGATVLRLAAGRPELVERSVLVSVPPAVARLPVFEPGLRLVQGVCDAFPALYGLAGRWLAADRSFFTGAELEGYLQPLRVRGTAASWRRLVRGLRDEQPIDPGGVSAPALLLWGERDRLVSLEDAWRLQRRLPRARLEVVPNAGHLVLQEQPRAANELVLDFLHELADERPRSSNGHHAESLR